MFVVLVAPSGKCRKGTAMSIGLQILRKTQTHIAAESITRQSFIRAIYDSMGTFFNPSTLETEVQCALTVFSLEFGVFLGVGQLQFIQDLCDIYDCRDRWTYQTKTQGTDALQGVCVNLLAATTPEYLQLELAKETVGIGLASRIIFVSEEEKSKLVPFPFLSRETRELGEKLADDLQQVSLLCGEFEVSREVLELYEQWYLGQMPRSRVDDPRFSGYMERQATHLKKLWIISSASRGDSKLVEPYDFYRAKVILEETEKRMPLAFGALGVNKLAPIMDRVYKWISRKKEASHTELAREFWRDASPMELKVIIEALREQKLVRIEFHRVTKEPFYRLWEDRGDDT